MNLQPLPVIVNRQPAFSRSMHRPLYRRGAPGLEPFEPVRKAEDVVPGSASMLRAQVESQRWSSSKCLALYATCIVHSDLVVVVAALHTVCIPRKLHQHECHTTLPQSIDTFRGRALTRGPPRSQNFSLPVALLT